METQDNTREVQIVEHCELRPIRSRIKHDADDEFWNWYELKSVTKYKGVSTARQVHLKKIEKWRLMYWIFANGPKTKTGMKIEELFIHHPETLEPFFKKCEYKIRSKLDKCDKVLQAAKSTGLSDVLLAEVEYAMEVGTRLDDPTIPWSLIKSGLELPVNDSETTGYIIREFVRNVPLKRSNFVVTGNLEGLLYATVSHKE